MNAVAVAAREAPPELQERIDALTALYERHAYLVYNVALVVCVAEEAALRAAERAFRVADEDGLVRRAVHCALEEAPDRPAVPMKPAVLAAVAQLGKVHRAAVALGSLAERDAAGVAAVLGTRDSAAEDLLTSAYRALGRHGGADALACWEWVRPPEELWRRVFTNFRAAPSAHAPVPDDAPPTAKAPRRGRRWPAVLLVLAAAGGLAGYALAGRDGGGAAPKPRVSAPALPPQSGDAAPAVAADGGPRPGDAAPVVAPNPKVGARAKPAKPLTPQELDTLRLRELSQLKEYTKRQADHSLPTEERAAAARQIARLEKVAQQRIDAADRRTERLRRQLVRERELRARDRQRLKAERERAKAERERGRPTPPPAPPTPAPPAASKPSPSSDQESSCLYNESDGSYICPEG